MSADITGFISWLRQWFDDIYALKGQGGSITVDDALDSTSENPVQNKVINSALAGKASSSHTHGYISNEGAISTTSTVITANNDYILYADRDNSTARKIRATTKVDNTLIVDTNAHSNIGSSANATQKTINTAIDTKLGQLTTLDQVYPVGAIYMSVNNTSPSTLFGGTWVQLTNTFLYASNAADANATTATAGESTHTLTVSEIPSHGHRLANSAVVYNSGGSQRLATSGSGTLVSLNTNQNLYTHNEGGNTAHNNMPPYMKVYMWKRTA